MDLKLRSRELPETVNDLLLTFDEIFYGADPLEAVKRIKNINYTQFINPIDITAVLAQLLKLPTP